MNAMDYANSKDASPVPPSSVSFLSGSRPGTGASGTSVGGRGGKNVVVSTSNSRAPPLIHPPPIVTRDGAVKSPSGHTPNNTDTGSNFSTPRVPQTTTSERTGRMERLERGWFPNEVNIPAHRLFSKDTKSPARTRQLQQFGREKVTFVTSQDMLYTPFAHPTVKERESLAHTFTQRVSANSNNTAIGTSVNDTIEYLKHSQRKLAHGGNLDTLKMDEALDVAAKAHKHFKPYSETLNNPPIHFPFDNHQGKFAQPMPDIQDAVSHKSKGDLMVMKRRQREEKRREIMKGKEERRKEQEETMNEKMKSMKQDQSGFSNRAILQYMLFQNEAQGPGPAPAEGEGGYVVGD